ncbi:MAG: carbohydrate ABC transporter permease [Candidatus Rokuibacteriota bacterium]
MRRAYPYATVFPVVAVVALFTVYPLLYSVHLSLHENVLTRPLDNDFVGLANFREVVTGYYFWRSLWSTALFAVMAVVAVTLYGLGTALLLDQAVFGSGLLKVVVLLPWAIPAVISGIIWRWIFDGDYGVLNGLLLATSVVDRYVPWMSHTVTARVCLVLAHVWKQGPLAAVFLLAALQVIPGQLYDAVRIDGAGRWNAFRFVTLPFLRATLALVLVYETIVAIATFDLVYVMTGGGPADATAIIGWYAYTEIFRFLDLGHGAALAIIIALMLGGLMLLYLRALRWEEVH